MNLEHAAPSASKENGATAETAAEAAPRTRRRRKTRAETSASSAEIASPLVAAAQPENKPERKPEPAPPIAMPSAGAASAPPPVRLSPISVPRPAERKPSRAERSLFRRHGPLAVGIALALGFGAYAGTQIGLDRTSDSAAAQGPSVNIASALPWKRDVAMASTQSREIARLKEELRGVRAQVDALRASPDQARQAQELRSLRAGLETLKEGLTAARTDAANAIAQISSAQSGKVSERDQQRVEKIAERLDRLERQIADTNSVATIPQKEAVKPVAVPDTRALPDPHALPTPAEVAASVQKTEPKPKVIHNYVLREVADGVALIEGPDGLREVWPGRGIPGAGKVTSIERQAGKWVVITSEGVIEYRRDAYSRN